MPVNTSRNTGFTLVEVLVSLAILVFGLLGLAGLISKGHRAAFEAYQRQQALAVANDIAERIRANQLSVHPRPCRAPFAGAVQPGQTCSFGDPTIANVNLQIGNTYAANATVATPLGTGILLPQLGLGVKDCRTTLCDEFERALFDLTLWEAVIMGNAERIGTSDVGTLINAVGCIETPAELAANGFVVPVNTYRISVAWQGDLSTQAPTASACGLGRYVNTLGAPDDATRRLVTLDITLTNPF